MNSKDWDSYLQSILGEFKPEADSLWEEFSHNLDDSPIESDGSDLPADEVLRDSLSNYTPDQEVSGWDRIADSLDQADKVFDTEVADKIRHYQAPYNPHAWSAFLKHFSAYKALRIKLIAAKVIEASAILLLVFTVFQMNQKGPFPLFAQLEQKVNNQTSGTESDAGIGGEDTPIDIREAKFADQSVQIGKTAGGEDALQNRILTGSTLSERNTNAQSDKRQPQFTLSPIAQTDISLDSPQKGNTILSDIETITPKPDYATSIRETELVTESLAMAEVSLDPAPENLIPYPVFVEPADVGQLEFGMLVQTDFNNLKMPRDILYSHQKQFEFPLQGISSVGYGAGFTLGVKHQRWAFESGVIYNAKTFKPGRRVTVGEGSDNSSIVFDAMQIQVISVPVQFRYVITPQPRFKLYGIAGLGMHVIAQSDIDVNVDYNFNSLPEGENPKDHPALANTIRESQRLSDKFRRKAPFSTKSYISANLGAGIEYGIADRKTVFLQATYQYQIPNLRFSNHNGKHLVSTSIQAGLRTPLSF